MKYGWILPVLLVCGLLAFPAQTFSAASEAASLWWTRLLPTLLPYLIAASLLVQSGVFLRVKKRFLPFAVLLCGALGGYPVGAKLAASLYARGAISRHDAETIALRADLPNPVFLLSVTAIGFFGDARCTLPLMIGVYGVALLLSVPLLRMRYTPVSPAEPLETDGALSDAIADGVRTVGVIGGCLVFASVLGALLALPFHGAVGSRLFIGLFEMTCGVREAAALPCSLALRLALCAFFVQFGGLSVHLQMRAQYPIRALRCLIDRALSGVLSAIVTYLLTPLFCKDIPVPTFASGAEALRNAAALASLTFSAVVGLLLVFVFTAGLNRKKARTPKNAGIS